MLAPIASRMSTPKSRVRAGTTKMPPPTPANAPTKPAARLIAKMPRSAPSGTVAIKMIWSPRPGRSAAGRRRHGSAPAGTQPEHLALAGGPLVRVSDRIHDQVGPAVDELPVDRPMPGEDDDCVAVGHQPGQLDRAPLHAIAVAEPCDVRVVEGNRRAAGCQSGQDIGRRRVAGIADVGLEGDTQDPDPRPIQGP